jgi:epoxyqueuosine reductase
MDSQTLTAALKEKALQLGFDLAGAAPVDSPRDFDYLEEWLENGNAGEMRFFSERREAYRDPNLVLDGVRSALMLGTNYRTVEPIPAGAGQGRVSRYAWGLDYHDSIRRRLDELAEFHRQLIPSANVRGVVDTAPFLERAHAVRAGLGWIGKNTTLINSTYGSWLFLAALLTTEELDFSPLPMAGTTKWSGPGVRAERNDHSVPTNPCVNCRLCLDACPTGALAAPYRLDARKCISYLTIEHRGEIPEELRSRIGDRIFGCDACQEACPWNRQTPATAEPAFYPREGMNPVDLSELRNLDEESFRRRFRGTPIFRAKFKGMRRNANL